MIDKNLLLLPSRWQYKGDYKATIMPLIAGHPGYVDYGWRGSIHHDGDCSGIKLFILTIIQH